MATNINRELYKGTIWSIIDNFGRQGITLVVFVVLARILQPSLFGLLNVSLLIVLAFKSITFDSIATAIVRKSNPTDLDFTTGFWFCILLSVPAFLILFFGANYIEKLIGTKDIANVIKGTSLILLTSGVVRMHEAWLTHRLKFKSLAIRSSISVALGGIAGIVLALKGFGVAALVSQQLVTSFTEFVMLWVVTPWKPTLKFSKSSFHEMVNFSKHVAVTAITNFANQNSDVFFVTYYLGTASSGIYSTGKRITNTLNFVISAALLRVSLPAFSRLSDDNAELQKTYLHSTALTAMITAPLFVGLAVLSKDITLVMLGKKWIGSAPVMQITTILGFLTSIGYYNQSIMLVKNKPQWQSRLTLLYAFTNILSFWIFTRYGLYYTALAFSLRGLFLYPVSAWCATKLTDIKSSRYYAQLIPSVVSAGGMALSIILLSHLITGLTPIIHLVILIPVGILVYAVLIYLTMADQYKLRMQSYLKARFAAQHQ